MLTALAYAFLPADVLTLVLAGILALLLGAIGVRVWRNSRVTPAERERRRRAMIATRGKMGDANLVEARDALVFYTYSVRGVQYTASQDLSALAAFMPADPSMALGAVYVKYDPRNPANSVVLAEDWTGFVVKTPVER
jgi:hypothetical protein